MSATGQFEDVSPPEGWPGPVALISSKKARIIYFALTCLLEVSIFVFVLLFILRGRDDLIDLYRIYIERTIPLHSQWHEEYVRFYMSIAAGEPPSLFERYFRIVEATLGSTLNRWIWTKGTWPLELMLATTFPCLVHSILRLSKPELGAFKLDSKGMSAPRLFRWLKHRKWSWDEIDPFEPSRAWLPSRMANHFLIVAPIRTSDSGPAPRNSWTGFKRYAMTRLIMVLSLEPRRHLEILNQWHSFANSQP